MNGLSALSTSSDPRTAVDEILTRLRHLAAEGPADVVIGFATSAHAETLGLLGRRVRAEAIGRTFLGCTGESIVGEDREIEEGPALAVLALRLPGAILEPSRISFHDEEFEGWVPPSSDAEGSTLLLLGDPFTFPTDRFLSLIEREARGLRVVGGMASASHRIGGNRLVLNDDVHRDGAVALRISGEVRVRAIVSQGCRPIGHTMIVTKVDQNVIRELGRRSAYEVLRETFDALDDDEKALVKNGLHLGRVINEYQESFRRGDFLVRNVIGVDESGGVVVNDFIRVGQTVQFHVRDAETADEDLRGLIEPRPSGVVGALLFTCNGRGSRMFSEPDHDVGVLRERLGPIPVAGFFAMGELGPIGGQNFVHGFTASVILFETSEDATDRP
ncbi:MAG: FIST N-terminal domain-containing protein [Isosphaeraceae bacterium]